MEISVWYQEAERVVYQGLGIRPLLLHSVCQSVIKQNAELVIAGKQNKSAVQICICMNVAVAKTKKKIVDCFLYVCFCNRQTCSFSNNPPELCCWEFFTSLNRQKSNNNKNSPHHAHTVVTNQKQSHCKTYQLLCSFWLHMAPSFIKNRMLY